MGAKEQELVPLHAAFDVVYRGFHRRQVIEHIENLEEQLRFTSLDRAEALAQAADLRKLLEMTRRDLEEARAATDPAARKAAYSKLQRLMVTDLPVWVYAESSVGLIHAKHVVEAEVYNTGTVFFDRLGVTR